MISGIGVDMSEHSHNNPHIYDLRLSGVYDKRNIENKHKILHLGNYTENLSLVLIRHSPLLSVIC